MIAVFCSTFHRMNVDSQKICITSWNHRMWRMRRYKNIRVVSLGMQKISLSKLSKLAKHPTNILSMLFLPTARLQEESTSNPRFWNYIVSTKEAILKCFMLTNDSGTFMNSRCLKRCIGYEYGREISIYIASAQILRRTQISAMML